jgi:hypothetical protein
MVFGLNSARAALGLARGCLPREIRLRRLRASKRAGRYFILGAWLLEWIAGGELRRHGKTSPFACEASATQNGKGETP